MALDYTPPGVYIEEKNAFPGSAVAVETAIPVFIGYTAKAERNGKSLVYKPARVTSLAVFAEYFGKGFNSQFTIADAPTPAVAREETLKVNGADKVIQINPNHVFLLYNAIRLFYYNGGSVCYILSVGTYGDKPDGFEIDSKNFTNGPENQDVFTILEKEYEPTLVVLPDVIAKDEKTAYNLYTLVLQHCVKIQSRFGIFDVYNKPGNTIEGDSEAFRDGIGTESLNYGAAYYPYLKTSVVQPGEVDYRNLDPAVKLEVLLPEDKVKDIVAAFELLTGDKLTPAAKTNYHQSLKAASPTYVAIIEEIRSKQNLLPPSSAIAGIYTFVDTARGVWKSPANVSLTMVNEPAIDVSHEEQQKLNVDIVAGKSINVIRQFPGIGTLVWGGRTLDGNSQDWRYINVRRTLIMIEQSLKLATRSYVFEANDANTWITISSMINNFLYNLWKQGALAGAAPEQAYNVQIGLGSTMTPNDILDGIIRITVMLAIVSPSEFIILTFQQQQQS
ncbi:phage tail sheath protein [Pedobacter cryoconitis]|uniref:Phage tail sheath protein n=1 Tax=Pedobacter cryoconitis TaxID=188932 RepID=A0A127VBU5_9SPHI|nr:phage tail sheath C-terminal domain-containing protein [Pedobacter cryoconitis]AMP98468.1 phage tail sheath protein [Pedobacter cryoconitis]